MFLFLAKFWKGGFKIEALEDEAPNRAHARRSLVALKNIPKGKTIEKGNLTFKRPAHGINPKFIDDVISKKALVDIKDDDVLKLNMFTWKINM